MSEIHLLDKWFPPCGPCGFCGHHDKRHRLWDVLITSPDTTVDLAQCFDLPVEAVAAVRRIAPYPEVRQEETQAPAQAAGDTPEAPGAMRNRLSGCWSLAAGGRVVHAWEAGYIDLYAICNRDLIYSDKPSSHAPTCPRCLAVLTRRQPAAAQAQAQPKPQPEGDLDNGDA